MGLALMNQFIRRGLGNMNSSSRAITFHAGSRIHGIAKELKARLLTMKDTGYRVCRGKRSSHKQNNTCEKVTDITNKIKMTSKYTVSICVPVTLPECRPTLICNSTVSSPMVAIMSLVTLRILLIISRANLTIRMA
jgi:hypothetical protein